MSINSRQKGKRGMESEVWKDIPGYEGLYQASNLGQIRSLPRTMTKGRVLKPYVNKRNGYCYVSMCKDGRVMTKRVHKMVYMAFHGDVLPHKYDQRFTIDHIDGDKTNNRIENLDVCDQSENQKRAYALGLERKTWRKPVIDLTTGSVFGSLIEAAQSVGGKRVCPITRVCQGKRSQYRNHVFAYYEDFLNGTIPGFHGKAKRSADMLWR